MRFWRNEPAPLQAPIDIPAAPPPVDVYSVESAAFLGAVFDAMAIAAFLLDRDGRVAAWNRACAALTGLSAAEVLGTREHWRGFYAAQRPCLADLVLDDRLASSALYATGGGAPADSARRKAQNWCDLPLGKRCYLEIDAVALFDNAGRKVAVVETLVDLTHLKQLEEDLGRARADTEIKIAEEREFVASTIGTSLAALSTKNLVHRMSVNLPEAYARLKRDFNDGINQLAEAFGRVSHAVQTVHSGAAEIASASQDLAERTGRQAISIEDAARSLDGVTKAVAETAEGAARTQDVVARTHGRARESESVVLAAKESMGRIESASNDVGQMAGLIDEIALQTNLLALNAGVEAARAGDAGRGFAVVAAAVRELARRTAEAAKNVKRSIAASKSEIATGSKLVSDTGNVIVQIQTDVREIAELATGIARRSVTQAEELGKVNTAIRNLEQITHGIASIAEETSGTSSSLDTEVEQLVALTGEFRITEPRREAKLRRAS